jgi:hypothetical protein
MCQPWKFITIMLSLLSGAWIGLLCVEAIGSDPEKPNPLLTKTTPSGLEVSVLEVTNLDEFLHGTCPPGRVEVPKLDRSCVRVSLSISPSRPSRLTKVPLSKTGAPLQTHPGRNSGGSPPRPSRNC